VNDIKIAIVVMAYNPYQYFAEFITHHSMLANHIYFIDHRSTKKFRDIDVNGVTFIESNQVAQFQSEVTNAVIRDFKLYEKYDWIFALDIDEFLPFYSENELRQFLGSYAKEKVLAFNWRNGVGVYPTVDAETIPEGSLIDVNPLLVSDFANPNIKVAVNCNNLKYPFFFRTGNHEVVTPRPILSKLTGKNKYKSIKPAQQHHFLYHIVSYDRGSFYRKIQNYVDQMEMRKHVKGQGGWMVRGYLVDFDDRAWLEIIQNFRVTREELTTSNVDESMFSRKDLFGHLPKDHIIDLKQRMILLGDKDIFASTEEEKNYIENKKLDTDLTANIERFMVKIRANDNVIEVL